MATLEQLREKISKIDHAVIKKLATRQKVAEQISAAKAKAGKPILDITREQTLLQLYADLAEQYQLDATWIKKLFKMIFVYSKKRQKMMQQK